MPEQPANAEPRRRWYHFSLRTLMIAIPVLALAFRLIAGQMHLAEERRTLIERFFAAGRFGTYVSRGEEVMVFFSHEKEFTPEEVREIKALFPEALIEEYFGGAIRPFNPWERMKVRTGLLDVPLPSEPATHS